MKGLKRTKVLENFYVIPFFLNLNFKILKIYFLIIKLNFISVIYLNSPHNILLNHVNMNTIMQQEYVRLFYNKIMI